MKKFIKNIFVFILILFIVINVSGCKVKNYDDNKLTIVTTNFPGYDFVRAITKNVKDVNIKLLLKPGSQMHDYEPTPMDIKNINNSDLFIYVGGDSDEWIEDILDDINTDKTKIVKLMDLVNTVEEEHVEGMEKQEHHDEDEETEYDEHVWTSPVNASEIINKLKNIIVKIDSNNKEKYEKNTREYVSELSVIDSTIREIVKNGNRKEIIFGDKFPFKYFVDEYDLSYYAAFPGCSDEVEASAKTISFLVNKVKKDKIPVVFYIELSNGNIAKQISKETGAKVLEFNSAHNITQKDFDAGLTYVDIMKRNIKNLKEALK